MCRINNSSTGYSSKRQVLPGATLFAIALSMATAAPASDFDAVVMTQNQYLGADLAPIISAQSPSAYNLAVLEALDQVAGNRIQERVQRLAASIIDHDAHLVGLQEVFRFDCVESGTLPGACDGFSDAMNDHLALTLDALDAQGGDYEVAALVENLTIPDAGFPLPGLPVFLDADPVPDVFIRVLDRDVILARSDVSTQTVSYPCPRPSADGCNFSAVGMASTLAGDITIERGYVAVDAVIDGAGYRFVNTHLEVRFPSASQDAPLIQALQASQLVETLAAVPIPEGIRLLVAGDINSSPNDPVFMSSYGPAWPPYRQLADGVNAWGQPALDPLHDLWNRGDGEGRRNTCCQSADLTNHASDLDERIDVIFDSEESLHSSARTDNDRQHDKTASGIWPSDHASVVARISD